MNVLEIRNLTKTFDGVTAVNNASFSVPEGSVFGLIGRNGAGKTTLINMITGIYSVTSGEIYLRKDDDIKCVEEDDIKDMIHGHRENITNIPMHKLVHKGICRTFQHLGICGSMSALENIMLGFDKFMSKNIIHKHLNGKLYAKNINDGAIFYIELPLS